MEYLWNIYGICMEYVWNIYGISVEYLWNIYGICMEYQWNTYGIPMGHLWNMYGICMEYVWNTYGIPMEYLWNIYGICMEYIWNIYGISMGQGPLGVLPLPPPWADLVPEGYLFPTLSRVGPENVTSVQPRSPAAGSGPCGVSLVCRFRTVRVGIE